MKITIKEKPVIYDAYGNKIVSVKIDSTKTIWMPYHEYKLQQEYLKERENQFIKNQIWGLKSK